MNVRSLLSLQAMVSSAMGQLFKEGIYISLEAPMERAGRKIFLGWHPNASPESFSEVSPCWPQGVCRVGAIICRNPVYAVCVPWGQNGTGHVTMHVLAIVGC